MIRSTFQQEHFFQGLATATRRQFLKNCGTGLGAIWLSQQMSGNSPAQADDAQVEEQSNQPSGKVKRIIFLHMIGAPSQLELFDYKPTLDRLDGENCPASLLEGKRFAFIQGTPQMLGHQYPFKQHGASGAWISDRLPNLAKHADDICFIKSMQTDQFNHGPAQLMVHTGQSRLGYPSIGSWVTYGLGTENGDLPGFIVLLSGGRQPRVGKALWSGGFLPSVYQGVQCRSTGDPVLNIANPPDITREQRRASLDALEKLNMMSHSLFRDPETLTRIQQYEMAYRMQVAVPECMDISQESKATLESYGAAPGAKSFANNCLLARKLAENGVRFIQLYDWGWDSHGAGKEEASKRWLQDEVRANRQTDCGFVAGLETTRLDGGYACGLERRIWSYADAGEPRRPQNAIHRSRPQSIRVYTLDGRCRREARHDVRRNG